MYVIRGYLLSIVDLCSGWVHETKAGMIAYIFTYPTYMHVCSTLSYIINLNQLALEL